MFAHVMPVTCSYKNQPAYRLPNTSKGMATRNRHWIRSTPCTAPALTTGYGMVEFSCADYTFPLLSRFQVLRLIRLLDFELIDIGLFERNSRFLPSQLVASPTAFAQSVREDLEAAELRVADVFLQPGPHPRESSTNDPNPAVRARNRDMFCRALDLCHVLGCAHMTGLPGVPHDDPAQDFDLAAAETTWRLNRCTQAGIVYSVEPHVGSICADTASVHRLLSEVRDLTLTLDYGHFISRGEVITAVHDLVPYASHIHARGAAPGRLQTLLADNTIDFSGMMSRLSQSQYRGAMTLEYVWTEWQDCNRTDNLSETILLRQHLRDIVSKTEGGIRCSH